MTTTEEKRQLLIEFFIHLNSKRMIMNMYALPEVIIDNFLSTLPDEEEKEFKRCGQGENTCNCKSPDECGYNEIYEGIAKLKH